MSKIKTTIVTGPLGSGKTTSINKLIPGLIQKERILGLVNDVGQLNVDSSRVSLPKEDILGYSSGCICCERKEDLEKILRQINVGDYDSLIVEPTGAANPVEIIDTILKNDEMYFLENVISLVPVKHFNKVQNKKSFRAGLESSNIIGYTWLNEDLDNVSKFLDEIGATKQRIEINDIFSYNSILNMGKWDISYLLEPDSASEADSCCEHDHHHNQINEHHHEHHHNHEHGESCSHNHSHAHEHYHTAVKIIRDDISLKELESVLFSLAEKGIERAKGNVSHLGYAFDVVNGSYSIRKMNTQESGKSLSKIVIIDENSISDDLTKSIEEGESDKSFAIFGSDSSSFRDAFSYYRSHIDTRPSIDGVVQANFEATDEAYSAAKSAFLSDKDDLLLKEVLGPYTEIRINALKELKESTQENKNYVGVMVGSYLTQMLTNKDNVPWSELTPRKNLEEIKSFAIPEYIEYLKQFSKNDAEYFTNYPKYSRFFAWMASEAKNYVSETDLSEAANNMKNIYSSMGDLEISKLWSDLE